MPTIDEAIKRAARALADNHILVSDGHYKLAARAALSAFLADVPVSEGVINAGLKDYEGDYALENSTLRYGMKSAYKAMCAKQAEEIQ